MLMRFELKPVPETRRVTCARRDVVLPGKPGIYHCMSRCVRRAFLCGFDALSGKNFDHRKEWVHQRLIFLAGVFCLDVLAYALMSNHLHVLVRIDPAAILGLTDRDVARRWLLLYPKSSGSEPASSEIDSLVQCRERIEILRERLGNISWLMKSLNESLARRANEEDDCTGRFWEGRFKCQIVQDAGAVLACAVYVDLNPIRAGMADRPENSVFTSAWERLIAVRVSQSGASNGEKSEDAGQWLAPIHSFLPMELPEYLSILDWTGRELRSDKRGSIPSDLLPILERLGIAPEHWVDSAEHYGRWFYRVVGNVESMAEAARTAGRRWFKGRAAARRLFLTPVYG